jgi:uncharacterized Zn finger protein
MAKKIQIVCPVKNKPVRTDLTHEDIKARIGQKMLLHCARCGGVHSFTLDESITEEPDKPLYLD